ncbi:YdeI/OmpD-associated family protein [Acidovorax sp. Q11]
MSNTAHHTFEAPEPLHAWLQASHTSETELWVRTFKKATGQPSVTWDDCVVAAIAWGWIDEIRKTLDDTSFLQRLTPRRARSNWSQKNVQHAERLIAQGRMQAAGLAQVGAARSDGR